MRQDHPFAFRMVKATVFVLALGSLPILSLPTAVSAQGIPPEIPLTDRVGVGARAMGMAGAYSAVADDALALFYNPAALARVERIEISTTLSYHRIEEETSVIGNTFERSVNPTRINHLGFVYPFPTYRGSFVVGMAFNRLVDLDRDYLRVGPQRGLVIRDEESIIEEGSLNAWTAGLAWDASPRASLGASLTLLTGTSFRAREYHFESTSGAFERSFVEDDADITGVTAALGALVRVGDHGRFSLTIDLPKSIDFEGDASEDILRYDGGVDTLDILDDFYFEENMTLPFSTTLGLSWKLGHFLLAGDLQFTDWTDIDFEGPLRTPPPERELAYRGTLGFRVGGELAPPRWPVRFRGGFGYDPVPYKIILTDVFDGEYAEADFSPDRFEISFGAGALLEESFTVDVAYSHRWFEREAPGVTEARKEDKVFFGAGFRF
jgi:long-subunit fatty acid transport protein